MKDTIVVQFKPITTYCFHMRLNDFLEAVQNGSFIDDDGHGYLATESQESSVRVNPSDVATTLLENPSYFGWATHVAWFNK